jgi:hypothetical protein
MIVGAEGSATYQRREGSSRDLTLEARHRNPNNLPLKTERSSEFKSSRFCFLTRSGR